MDLPRSFIINVLKNEVMRSPSAGRREWLRRRGFPVDNLERMKLCLHRELVAMETEIGCMFKGRSASKAHPEPGITFSGNKLPVVDRWLPLPTPTSAGWLADSPEEWSDAVYPDREEALKASVRLGLEAGYRVRYSDAAIDAFQAAKG